MKGCREHYYAILKKDASVVPSGRTDVDSYALDLDIYTTEGVFVVEKLNQAYIDEKKIYKAQLKAGSKWMATFIPDITGIIKLEPHENNQPVSFIPPPNEDDIEIVTI